MTSPIELSPVSFTINIEESNANLLNINTIRNNIPATKK